MIFLKYSLITPLRATGKVVETYISSQIGFLFIVWSEICFDLSALDLIQICFEFNYPDLSPLSGFAPQKIPAQKGDFFSFDA